MTDSRSLKIFIAGIIQGSYQDQTIEPQEYRDQIKSILTSACPEISIFCPVEHHPQSILYDDKKASTVFYKNVEIAASFDILIVFLPEASMGSSIEMWEARKKNSAIITITPMKENWVVRILSDVICSSMEEFRAFIEDDGLTKILNK